MISAISNAQITFQKTYGDTALETMYDARQTNDKGFIMVGQTYSFGAGYGDVYLVKTDSTGDTLWTRTYGGIHDDGGYRVEQTTDSGYIIIGYTFSFGIGQEDVYIIKTNSVGDTLWTEAFGGTLYDYGTSIRQTSDGGYIFTGYTQTYTPTLYLIKLNNGGTPVWVQTFGNDTAICVGNDVHQTSDGGYIIVGTSNGFPPDTFYSDVYLIKTNNLGELQWSRTFGGSNADYGYSVQQTTDGGYVIAGTTYSFGEGNGDIYVIKTDGSGNLTWSNAYGGPNFDDGKSIWQADDGSYFVVGTTNNYLDNMGYVCLLKIDSSGNLLFSEVFGGSSCDNAGVSVQQTADGGCIIGGNSCSFLPGNGDFYLMKTEFRNNLLCSNGPGTLSGNYAATTVRTPITEQGPTHGTGGYKTHAGTNVSSGGASDVQCYAVGMMKIKEKDFNSTIFPNPCNDYTTINLSGITNKSDEYNLEWYDVLGKAMDIDFKKKTSINSIYFNVNTKNLSNGVYFCKIISGNDFITTLKVLVNK